MITKSFNFLTSGFWRSLVVALVMLMSSGSMWAQDRDYLCFTSTSNDAIYLSLVPIGGISDTKIHLQYTSTPNDDSSWKTFKLGQRGPIDFSLLGIDWKKDAGTELRSKGNAVYLRADPNFNNGKNSTFSESLSNYYHFTVVEFAKTAGGVDISGNIMSLLDATCLRTDVPEYAFCKLFDSSSEISIHQNVMVFFRVDVEGGSFHAAPELPATELGQYCYKEMFKGCKHLNQAPRLPAQTLARGCYDGMFNGCSGINYLNVGFTSWYPTNDDGTINTGAGVATSGWTNGVAASGTFVCPVALEKIYNTNSNKSYIPWNPNTSGNRVEEVSDKTNYLCFTVTSTTSWIRLDKVGTPSYDLAGKLEFSLRDANHFKPYTWTEDGHGLQINLNRDKVGEEEPVYRVYFRTNVTDNSGKLNQSAYNVGYRFVMPTGDNYIAASGNIMSLLKKDCTREDVPDYAFHRLFQDCSRLTSAPEMPAKKLGNACYQYMFLRSSVNKAPELPATVMKPSCYSGMFQQCYRLGSAPALPAMTLANSCYNSMFMDCTSLTTAPELKATKMATSCYANMFTGCTSLNFISVGFYEWDDYTSNWVASCSSHNSHHPSANTNTFSGNGTFVCPNVLPHSGNDVGLSKVPSGWSVKTIGGANDYLSFSAERNGSKLRIDKSNVNAPAIQLVYSTDEGSHWNNYTWSGTTGTTIVLDKEGTRRVYFRAGSVSTANATTINKISQNALASALGYNRFVTAAGSFSVSGNVLSLLESDCKVTTLQNYAFYRTFQYCNIVSAPNIPVSVVGDYACQYMFLNCTLLRNVPDLSSITTVGNSGFMGMFLKCYNLENVPAILPATKLGTNCYQQMFRDCTSMSTAPILPATQQQLSNNCYQEMFAGCSSLSYINVNFTSWGSNDNQYTKNWVQDCNNTNFSDEHGHNNNLLSTGTFIAPNTLPIKHGPNNIPWKNEDGKRWTVNPSAVSIKARDGNTTVRLHKEGSPAAINIVYSTDLGATWSPCWYGRTDSEGNPVLDGNHNQIIDEALITLSQGETVMFRAADGINNASFSQSTSNYYHFEIDNNAEVTGNVLSLLKEDCNVSLASPAYNYAFYKLFSGCDVVSAPDLPATTLAAHCYRSMFEGCDALTSAPELPATDLKNYCYLDMFKNCTSLSTAPELKAETVVEGCYQGMFYGCEQLTTAPDLPAQQLEKCCYKQMFYKCSLLRTISVGFSAWDNTNVSNGAPNANNATYQWVSQVASSGDFYSPEDLTPRTQDAHHIPNGWDLNKLEYLTFKAVGGKVTIALNKIGEPDEINLLYRAPGMRAYAAYTWDATGNGHTITLNNGGVVAFRADSGNGKISKSASAYYQFSMTSADGQGTVVADGNVTYLRNCNSTSEGSGNYECYRLFKDCQILTKAPGISSNSNVGSYSFAEMFMNTSITNAPSIPSTPNISGKTGTYLGMFRNCKYLDSNIPASLSGNNLSTSCFESMFEGCESMTTVPELPNTNLVTSCYKAMFKGCKSLTTTPDLSADNIRQTLKESCFESMFEGCESLTVPAKFPSMDANSNQYLQLQKACFKRMYAGCTSLQSAPMLLQQSYPESCFEGMFEGCISLKKAPTLPLSNSKLGKNCFKRMFANCIELLAAPDLPAVNDKLEEGCYVEMFDGCSSLKYISVAFSEWKNINGLVTENWVRNVAPVGTFMCPDGLEKKPAKWSPANSYDSHIPAGWSAEDNGNYLCITCVGGYDKQLLISKQGNPSNVTIQYSSDRKKWNTVSSGIYMDLFDESKGNKVYIKIEDGKLSESTSAYYYFNFCGADYNVSGNIMSLLDASMMSDEVPDYAFYKLFAHTGDKLKSIEGLELPATKVGDYAYAYMFDGCSVIKTSNTKTPALPATTLGKYCYQNLFEGWTALTKAPTLPATDLAEGCYQNMFKGCTSLTTAPVLPAETLFDRCYEGIFNGCSSMNSINVSFKEWPNNNATTNWVKEVKVVADPDHNDCHIECPWELLNAAVNKWPGDGEPFGGDGSRLPRDPSNRWVILLHTDMQMNYGTGQLTISGKSPIYVSTSPLSYNGTIVIGDNVGEPHETDSYVVDVNEWLNSASEMDSITYYAIAGAGASSIAVPSVNSVTLYRLPRRAGYCYAYGNESLQEILYYASKVSSANYPVKIFVPEGEYSLEKTATIGEWTSLIGESDDYSIVSSRDANGVLNITGNNNYLQDVMINSKSSSKIAFTDNAPQNTTTLNIAIGSGNKYTFNHGITGERNVSPEWTRDAWNDAASVSINQYTMTINSNAPAFFIRIGNEYTLTDSKNLYILRNLDPNELIVRAANRRGGFGAPCPVEKFVVVDDNGTEFIPTTGVVKTNTYGFASFCFDGGGTGKAISSFGASAYVAKFDPINKIIVLSHINEHDIIPERTGVILFGAPSTEVKFYEADINDANYDPSANDLIGNWHTDKLVNGTDITPASGNEFYGLKGNTFTFLKTGAYVGIGKAYMEIALPRTSQDVQSSSAYRLVFGSMFDDDTSEDEIDYGTGISCIELQIDNAPVYNLNGQRNSNMKGLIVKNGKVVMMK